MSILRSIRNVSHPPLARVSAAHAPAGPLPTRRRGACARARPRDNFVFTGRAARTCERLLAVEVRGLQSAVATGRRCGRTFGAIDDVGTRRGSVMSGRRRRVARNTKSFAKANLRRHCPPGVRADARHTNWRWRRRVRLLVPSLQDRRGRVAKRASSAQAPSPTEAGETPRCAIARVPRVARRAAGRERDTWHTASRSERWRYYSPDTEVPEMEPGRDGVPAADRDARKATDFLGRARRALHERAADASPARLRRGKPPGPMFIPIKASRVLGTTRGSRRARTSSASVVWASAGTHLAAEAMVMEEAILLTGESGECCDGR